MDEHRRRRLIAFFLGLPFKGDRGRLIKASGLSKGRIAQFFDPDEAFGERAARNLAVRLKLSSDYFERDQPPTSASSSAAASEAVETVRAVAAQKAQASGYVRLPLFAEASAGPGRLPIDTDGQVVPHVEVLESWVRDKLKANPKNLYVLTVRGNSMRGVVEDGDILFVEPCTKFDPEGLYVLTLGDLVLVKRLSVRLLDGMLSIESTDGRAPELVPISSIGSTVHIQGRVVGAWGLRQV